MTMPSDRPIGPVGPVGKAPWLLARFAQGAIAVAAVAEVFRAVTVRAHRLNPVETSASRSGFASMVLVYAMTASAALFLTWFHRCRRNARTISPGAEPGSDTWAVVAWLIPVVNLWVPRGLLLGALRASDPAADGKGRDGSLVQAWWVAWTAHGAIALVGQSRTSLPLLVVAQALDITAAILAIGLVQRITAVQSTALDAVRPAPQGTPTA